MLGFSGRVIVSFMLGIPQGSRWLPWPAMSVLLCACHQGLFFPKLTRLALLRFNASLLRASRASFAALAAPPIGESFFIKSLKLQIWAGSFYFGSHSPFIGRKVLGKKTG